MDGAVQKCLEDFEVAACRRDCAGALCPVDAGLVGIRT
jgi:hypothetical protein